MLLHGLLVELPSTCRTLDPGPGICLLFWWVFTHHGRRLWIGGTYSFGWRSSHAWRFLLIEWIIGILFTSEPSSHRRCFLLTLLLVFYGRPSRDALLSRWLSILLHLTAHLSLHHLIVHSIVLTLFIILFHARLVTSR